MAWPKKSSDMPLTETQKRCREINLEMERNRRLRQQKKVRASLANDVDEEYAPSDDESLSLDGSPVNEAKKRSTSCIKKKRGKDSPGIRPPKCDDLEPSPRSKSVDSTTSRVAKRNINLDSTLDIIHRDAKIPRKDELPPLPDSICEYWN